MGYFKAQSLVSLFTASFFALLLFISCTLLFLGKAYGRQIAIYSLIFLEALFAYRFTVKPAFFPSGIILLLGGALLLFLLLPIKQS